MLNTVVVGVRCATYDSYVKGGELGEGFDQLLGPYGICHVSRNRFLAREDGAIRVEVQRLKNGSLMARSFLVPALLTQLGSRVG